MSWIELNGWYEWSLEVLEEVSERAVSFVFLLFEAEDAAVLGSVGYPLWSECKVVVHPLVAEVEMLISKGWRVHGGSSNHFGNELFFAAKLCGYVCGIDVEQGRTRGDWGKIGSEICVTLGFSGREVDLASGLES